MIQLIDVSKEYRSADSPTVCALKNINLELPDRGMVFILGKSGSGKSTLLNVIGHLLPQRAVLSRYSGFCAKNL